MRDKIMLYKYKIKRWYQYWFNRKIYDEQFGDFFYIKDLIDESLVKEIETIFRDQISFTCFQYKYEIIGKINIIMLNPITKSDDPLSQGGTVAWKAMMRVHNRKSWGNYIESLIGKEIKFKKPKID